MKFYSVRGDSGRRSTLGYKKGEPWLRTIGVLYHGERFQPATQGDCDDIIQALQEIRKELPK